MPDTQATPTTDEKIAALESSLSKLLSKVNGLVARKDSAAADDARDDEARDDADEKRDDEKAKKDAARDALFGSKRKDAKRDDEFPPKDKDEDEDEKEKKSDASARDDEDEDEDEKKKESKDDAAKRDDEDEDEDEDKKKRGDAEEKGEPEAMASDDDRRKDRKDAKRDDEKRDDERKDKRDDSRADAIHALRQRIAQLERNTRRPRSLTDDEMNSLAERQQEWDRVAQMHGQRASRPLDGERIQSYDRRMAKVFQKHSSKWKDTDLAELPIEVISKVIAPEIRADSIAAAYRVEPADGAMLREVRKSDRTGRVISEFVGPVNALNGALAPFRMPSARVRRINTQPNQY